MSTDQPREPKQYVVEHIRDLLAQDPRVGELDIHVKVVGDRVFVRGTVPTTDRRDVITRVLETVISDYEVNNELSVVEVVENTEEERLS
jgi:osmotically-inducible protein OsmY